jgi:DNA invertase Pin-like site-specific DNA recombinase
MFVRAYLRASTKDQDADRARGQLEAFASERGLKIATWYTENESGASLKRPELFRLLSDCQPGDILLIEQVDRLSRLNAADWERLRAEIASRHVKVVAMDLPTSHQMATAAGDEFTGRMLEAVNGMMLDMLAAIARKDYEDRRRRQAQGIANTRKNNPDKYQGGRENVERNEAIMRRLRNGDSWDSIQRDYRRTSKSGKVMTVSRSTLARLAKRVRAEEREAV